MTSTSTFPPTSTSTDETVQIDVRGTRFPLLDPGHTVAAETFSELGYEPAVVDLLDRVEARLPRAVFCDIGALHGYYSALAATRYRDWRVYGFEPNPEAFAVLERNFRDLGIDGEARRQAINDTGDALHFKGRTIVDPATADAIVVPGRRLDDLLPDLPAGDLVVKIDVHGAEALVLAGMREALAGRVKAAIVEVHAQHLLIGERDYAAMLEMLEDAGLQVFELADFRHADETRLVPLTGAARQAFADYSQWTREQVDRERLIVATRLDGLRV